MTKNVEKLRNMYSSFIYLCEVRFTQAGIKDKLLS